MIKAICFLKRNPALNAEQFHRHWREVHAPLFADTPLRRHIRRYEQNPRLPADYDRARRGSEVADAGFDGVTVLWYDRLEDFQAMVTDPLYQAQVMPDERKLLDTAATCWLIAGPEQVIVDKPGGRARAGAKLLSIFQRNPQLDIATFRKHWRENHGGLFQNVPSLNKDILAYDQNPRLDEDYAMAPERSYDGVTEQWFESLDSFIASLDEPEQASRVFPDVQYMLNTATVHFLMSAPPSVIIADDQSGQTR
ncbi:MAG: EthD domain-containing protein [Spongiibacteraceae bacterium]|jgi:uncharacterized protein (TIGR02118 family)|nr:EthD domain-containing protein [Spongiibacteraceae bacterium]